MAGMNDVQAGRNGYQGPTGMTPGTMNRFDGRTESGKTGPAGPYITPMTIQEMFTQYINHLMGPLDMSDPRVKSILNGAYSSATSDAANRGIQGPMAMTGGQQSYINAAAGLQQQQQALGTSLMGQYAGWDTNQKQLAIENAQNQYAAALNKYKADQANGQGMGSMIGGGLGLAAGVGATILTGGAAAPLIPGLMAGGSTIGGGIGGMAGAGNLPVYQGPANIGAVSSVGNGGF